jgi:hypothetical protein
MLRREIKMSYQRLVHCGGWRAVGREFGISGGMAFRIAEQGYEPKGARNRLILGLPAFAPAPLCATCGVVHLKKCAVGRKSRRPAQVRTDGGLWDLPVKTLKWMFENRKEFGDGEQETG